MHCATCRRQRPPDSAFCILCGTRLTRRSETEIAEELSKVEWLITESTRWDVTLVSRADASRLAEFYTRQATWLRAELEGSAATPSPVLTQASVIELTPTEAPVIAPTPEPTTVEPTAVTEDPPPVAPALPSSPEPVEAPPAREHTPSPATLEAVEPEPVAEVMVREASTWSRVWKPFLTDSVGWFIGGFLILAGVYWLVADAWAGMTSLVRAVTVFGLASGWTLAFFAWSAFLSRRPTTAPAAHMLERLAACIAPLAPIALGPVHTTPVLFWPLTLGWALVAAFLARRAVAREDDAAAGQVAAGFFLATAMMGVAPLAAGLGPFAAWLTFVPVGLSAWLFSAGPRATGAATRLVVVASCWALLCFVVRLEVALAMAHVPVHAGLLAPAGALFLASLRWLAPPSTRAADVFSVSVVLGQVALAIVSFDVFTPKPAFVVTSLVAGWTALRLARERVSAASARWLPVAYVFAYLAYQRVDQLVPAVVLEWWAQFKAWLGYASAPLPASYGSVYAALFVAVVGVLAWRRALRSDPASAREGEVLLDTTAVAVTLSSALAVVSLGTDARPAMVATPVLALTGLGLALVTGRLWLTVAGTLATLGLAAALQATTGAPVGSAAVGLGLALVSIPALAPHRRVLALGGGLVAAGSATLAFMSGLAPAFVAAPGPAPTVALVLASVALLLLSSNQPNDELLDLAWLGPVLTVVTCARWLAGDAAAFVLAASMVGLAAVSLLRGRWRSTALMSGAGALAAVAWSLVESDPVPWPAVTMLVAAGALGLASRATAGGWRGAFVTLAWLVGIGALAPVETLFPWPAPLLPLSLAGLLVLAASLLTVRRGRSWEAALVASLACLVALAWGVSGGPGHLALAAVVVTVATPALLPAVTLPVATLVGLVAVGLGLPGPFVEPACGLLALVLAAAGFVDRSPSLSRWLALGRPLLTTSTVMSALVLACALVFTPTPAWLPMVFALTVPLVWSFAWRKPQLRLVSVALVSAAAFWMPGALLVAPALALVVAFTLPRRRGPAVDHPVAIALTATALLSVICARAIGASPTVFAAWAAVLLVLPTGALALRLGAAALACALLPAGWPLMTATALFGALGLGLRHAEAPLRRVLGARSLEFVGPVVALAPVGLSLVQVAVAPGVVAQGLLVGSLLLATLLTGWGALLPVAALGSVVDLERLVSRAFLSLAPQALAVTTLLALVAAGLRQAPVREAVERGLDRLGTASRWLDSFVWGSAVAVMAVALLDGGSAWWLVPGALLLVTPRAPELVAAAGLLVLGVFAWTTPLEWSVPLALLGCALAWLGAVRESPSASARLHVGWALVLVAMALALDLHAWQLPVTWALGAATGWALVRRHPAMRWFGWVGVLAASHVALAWLGTALSTGAPVELILPWFALASALVACWPAVTPMVRQHGALGLAFRLVSLLELLLSMTCPPHHHAEVVAVALAALVQVLLGVVDAKADRPRGVWLATLSVSLASISGQLLLGGEVGLTQSIVALVLGVVASGLSVGTQSGPQVQRALQQVAVAWPLLGVLAAPWASSPHETAALLTAVAVHAAVNGRLTETRLGAVISGLAFNAAVVTLWFGSGWGEPQYALVPVGLTGLVLVQLFRDELGVAWSARARAGAVALIYSAAAFRPLAFDAPWLLFLCVLLCVLGVGAGVALRIRSFVTLGTAFLVTTVVATLVRWGVREPRLGALFLSGLGLAVVAFMVLVTTKRTELLERYQRVRGALERWQA